MRTRDEIEGEWNAPEGIMPGPRENGGYRVTDPIRWARSKEDLEMEVLLDIRDMLSEFMHPIYEMDRDGNLIKPSQGKPDQP